MPWIKKGLIYSPNKNYEWSQSHAHVVCADLNYTDKIRVYYSARNAKGLSSASFVDLDKNDISKVIYEHPEPILDIGELGTFDELGIMPTWFIEHNGKKMLYYVGWNVRNTIPYHNAIGLATSEDGVNFKKFGAGPIIERIPYEPQFSGSACILYDKGIFKIWYLNCTHWHKAKDGNIEPCYHIKYAESKDGINWIRNAIIAIDYKSSFEGGISRPSVIFEDGIYKMWYSYRGIEDYRKNKKNSYRIGYAESEDGVKWERKDKQVGIDVSESGWDSEMIEYPLVFNLGEQKIMFYNGNEFGKEGFGYAVYES